MQCVILAGGLGTRLRPLTESLPKALIPVAGRPFADLQLAQLRAWGFDDVIYSIGFGGEQIRAFVGDGGAWGLSVRYSDEGSDLRGTGGALRVAHDQGLLDTTVGLIYGDSYLTLDARAVWSAFDPGRDAALMTVFRNDGAFDTSNAHVEGDRVARYEKGLADPLAAGMRHIDYGFSILDTGPVMELTPPGQVVDLATVYTTLSRQGRLGAYEVSDRFYEIGSHTGLAELEAVLGAS